MTEKILNNLPFNSLFLQINGVFVQVDKTNCTIRIVVEMLYEMRYSEKGEKGEKGYFKSTGHIISSHALRIYL